MSAAKGPKPWAKHQLSTIFLRVPQADFGLVRAGRKTEFRVVGGDGQSPQLWAVEFPSPAVGYMFRRGGGYKSTLLVIQAAWREPLGAISPESLEREGQPDIAHFRRYWMARNHTNFKPTREVSVFRVRPWTEDDREMMARLLFHRLYGEFLV